MSGTSPVEAPRAGLGRFAALLRTPHVRRLTLASLLARLPFGTDTLAVLLYVQDKTGSFASGGLITAVIALSDAIAVPLSGRLVDRVGQAPVLVATAAIHALGIVLVLVLGAVGAPLIALALAAAVVGVYPPVSPCLRGLWPGLLDEDPERVRTALALDAILLEAVFVGGPLLAGAVFAVASPAAALAVVVVLSTAGTLAFASAPPSRRWRGTPHDHGLLGVLRSPGMRTLLLTALPIGVALGTMEVALSAFGVEHGSKSIGAVAIACLAIGSAAGGIVYGVRVPSRVRRTYVVLCCTLPLGVALLAAAGPVATLFLLAPVAGAMLAPLTAAENELVASAAPAGMVTEAYGWLIMAMAGGIAAGVALAGAVVEEHGWREALLAGAACAAVGALVAVTRRRTLAA